MALTPPVSESPVDIVATKLPELNVIVDDLSLGFQVEANTPDITFIAGAKNGANAALTNAHHRAITVAASFFIGVLPLDSRTCR